MLDLVVLTDPRYVNPDKPVSYVLDVLKEDQIVMDACQRQGLSVERRSWDDPYFDWSSTKAVIFRSTWDYFDRFTAFEQWLQKVKRLTKFINPEELVFWNVDKKYLLDLAAEGVEIVPTYFIRQGAKEGLKEIANRNDWQEIVIKPTVSATAKDTYRFSYQELTQPSTQNMFDVLCEKKDMMIQPFLSRVLEEGELSVIVIGGKVTHGVRKVAKSGDYRVQSDFGGSIQLEQPDKEAIVIAEKVIKSCPAMPLYARVDLIKNHLGKWNLGEVELIEPELWFRLQPSAAESLAISIHNYLKK